MRELSFSVTSLLRKRSTLHLLPVAQAQLVFRKQLRNGSGLRDVSSSRLADAIPNQKPSDKSSPWTETLLTLKIKYSGTKIIGLV